jgi:hypothetical protein
VNAGINIWGQIVGWAGTTQIVGFLATPRLEKSVGVQAA